MYHNFIPAQKRCSRFFHLSVCLCQSTWGRCTNDVCETLQSSGPPTPSTNTRTQLLSSIVRPPSFCRHQALAIESNAGQRFLQPSVTRRLLPRWRVPHLVLGPNSKNRICRKSSMPPRMDSVPRNCSFSLSDLVCLLFLAAPDEQDTIEDPEVYVLTFDFPPAGVIERPHQWRGGGGGASLWHRLKMPLRR